MEKRSWKEDHQELRRDGQLALALTKMLAPWHLEGGDVCALGSTGVGKAKMGFNRCLKIEEG